MGADFIEPDLVSTKDHVLVARHEPTSRDTTDVADHPEFADRKTTKTIDGITDHRLVHRGLHARRAQDAARQGAAPGRAAGEHALRRPLRDPDVPGGARPARAALRRAHRPIGIYPETKHPTYFRSIGLPLEEPLVAALNEQRPEPQNAPVFVQSFETGNLRALTAQLQVPLVQLLGRAAAAQPPTGDTRTYADLAKPAGLEDRRYADGVGPARTTSSRGTPTGRSGTPTTLRRVTRTRPACSCTRTRSGARTRSFRPSCARRPTPPASATSKTEIRQFLAHGIDGFFTDNADIGVEAVSG